MTLKKGVRRPHIHRYSLRFKTKNPKSDDEEQQVTQSVLQKFLEIVLQGDPLAIIPPYLDIDRVEKKVVDISSAFSVASIDSFHSLRKYFFRMSPRNSEGQAWCSIILALSIPFPQFIDKIRYSLENQYFGLWLKASDNENTFDVGWLLYSTCYQDEERLASLFSRFTGESLGVKWKPIKTTTGPNRKKDPQDSSGKIHALHIECASDRIQEVRSRLSVWYDSSSSTFPDGTKMRLVPTYNSVLSVNNKTKFASCLAHQAALPSGLAIGTTWEMSNNLMLDQANPDDPHGITFKCLIMSIPYMEDPDLPLFHTVDKQWRSDNVVTLTFRPKHEAEARSIIAGLIPFLRDEGYEFFLQMFSPEAQGRHASSKWNSETRQVSSVEEEEFAEFLAGDDDLNLSDEPTQERLSRAQDLQTRNAQVEFDVPSFMANNFPSMNNGTDSISTFHPIKARPQARVNKKTHTGTDLHASNITHSDSVSKLSDTASKISTLKSSVSDLDTLFKSSFTELGQQAKKQAEIQYEQGKVLNQLLAYIKSSSSTPEGMVLNPPSENSPTSSDVANNPQTNSASDSD
jgi:hypothetical protein